MAHYAFIDENNIVVEVITGRDEDDLTPEIGDWETYYSSLRPGLRCLRTSYNTFGNQHITGGVPFRGNFAGLGFTYDEGLDAFIAPQPYPSWLFDEETLSWFPPEPHPEAVGAWGWDEGSQSWIEVEP